VCSSDLSNEALSSELMRFGLAFMDNNMLRVLIVDDLPDAAECLGALVELWGHESRVALSGEQAVREAAVFQPHIILADLAMAGMGGIEVARRVRTLPGQRDVVIVATTGLEGEGVRTRAAAAGIEHYLVKPWDADILRDLVDAYDTGATVHETR